MNAAVATSVFGVFMVATVALGLLALRGRGGGEAGSPSGPWAAAAWDPSSSGC